MAAVAVLVLALVSGFVWYEHSRPPSRVLALVAALSALAVVGRIAFAPLPNVKPATTDVVLFAGFALGGAPGFATGAVAALISNFFFEQGAWTPWQMAGWALVGVGGAGLARVAGRELGRWPLAIACGVAGLVFGAVMDTYQWTLASHQDLPTWIAVSGTSLPYNLAHAIGNFVFALALGPAFVRSLARYRRRFEINWAAPAAGTSAASIAALACVAAALVAAPGAHASGTGAALSYLRGAQNADGGFGAVPGASSNQLYTGWAALGMAAGGRSPNEPGKGGRSAIDYMRAHAGALNDVGELERTILVLRAGAVSARSFTGRNLVSELLHRQRGSGSFEKLVNHTAFGILSLRAAGVSGGPIARAAGWLGRQQNGDGGFGFAPHSVSEVDDTGAALQALAAAGSRGKRTKRAVGFLRRTQNADGGFGQYADSDSNSQSTAWAVQGLVAAGRSPARMKQHGHSPLAFLRSMMRGNGSVRYSRHSSQTPVWVTGQAIVALARKAFPVRPVKARHASARARAASARKSSNRGQPGAGGGGKVGSRSASGGTDRGVEPVPTPRAAALRRAAERLGGSSRSDGPSAALLLLACGAGLLLLGAGGWWRAQRHPRDA
ncbi:MAG: energy-coupling factor transport system substrate-specific component [Thermoleophilaceae bacterium]|jgi:energy-coupling factor transport system substrate-specific component|nr:energy-coupling factor transport system substrate-specific component [Thermoleophilaceae bacterium]